MDMVMETSGLNRWLTAKEVAELTGFDKSTIYRWWRQGLMPSIVVNGSVRMTEQQLRDFEAKHTFGSKIKSS